MGCPCRPGGTPEGPGIGMFGPTIPVTYKKLFLLIEIIFQDHLGDFLLFESLKAHLKYYITISD